MRLAEPLLVDGVKRAKLITRVLFGTDVSELSAEEVLGALANDQRLHAISADEMYGTTVLRLCVNHGVTKSAGTSLQGSRLFTHSSSLGAAKSLVAMRGLYLNDQTVDAHRRVQPEDLIDGRLVIVRAGKDKHAVFALQT
jgi:tyrosyl-tRNA synthetase